MKTILAPVDFSPVTADVVAEAARLALALPGRVVLLNVARPAAPPYEYPALAALVEEAGRDHAKLVEKKLGELTAKLRADFISVKSLQTTGNPVAEIIDCAAEVEADYIVMGSHGHTAFYDLLMGSTTHGVLNRAHCPLIIVPARKASKTSAGKPSRRVRELAAAD